MNNLGKIIGLILVIVSIVIIASCLIVYKNPSNSNLPTSSSNSNNLETNTVNSRNEITGSNDKKMTISDIKAEYTTDSPASKYIFKPFYNVEQTTEFAFRFKSNVDPVKAITVHTDSRCDEASTVFQLNDGYRTNEGIDVIVKPRNPILGSKARLDIMGQYHWGYAPIYYICVRYDMDSTEVKKLENPIIIPFTVKNEISTPTAYASISDKGVFSVDWLPVDGAKEYRIYYCMAPNKNVREYSREQLAYAGEDVHLKLLKTVDANVHSIVNDSYTPENMYKRTDSTYNVSYNTMQNVSSYYTYYVTAVDEFGHESFFSKAVADWQFEDTLPQKESTKLSFSYITEFPNVIKVAMINDKVSVDYPINFKRIQTPSEFSTSVYYYYEILNTCLSGIVSYKNEEGDFPEEHLSTYKINNKGLYKEHLPEIAPVDVPQVIDKQFINSSINLKDSINYPKETKIQLDPAQIYRRVDLELARMIQDGLYPEPLDSISTYVASDNPEYIVIKHDGVIEVVPSKDYDPNKATSDLNTTKVEQPKEEINNSNYVDVQKESTKRDVEEGDKVEVSSPDYPIVANTAGQKYLAIQLMNHVDEIDLKAFPEYQNLEELIDDVYYIWYQNPYIMTLDVSKFKYNYSSQSLKPFYCVDANTTAKYQEAVFAKSKDIASKIITSGMSDYDKTIAIFDYLEKNGNYNHEALEYGEKGNDDLYEKYPNSWNTYGILCENLGVCQSYAYAYNAIAMQAGLETMMVTGTIQNGGHAWNATKLDGNWYMIDSTNNNKNGDSIPYWFVNIGNNFAKGSSLIPDGGFVDGNLTTANNPISSDNSLDWYVKNDLYANSISEIAQILKQKFDPNQMLFIKYNTTINFENSDTLSQIRSKFVELGGNVNDLKNVYIVPISYGTICFVPASLISK